MPHSIIPEDILEFSRARATEFNRARGEPKPARKELGQIWSTFSAYTLSDGRSFQTDDPRLVVILDEQYGTLDGGKQLLALPLSLNIEMASQWDLIVPLDLSQLRFSFMVEVWNQTPVLPTHLKQFLGKLPDEAEDVLQDLYNALWEGEDVPSDLRDWVGISLMGEEDPRAAFQRAEIAAIAYLANAATAALELELAKEAEGETVLQTEGRRRVLDLRPVLGKLSRIAFQKGLQVGYAAGGIGERDTYLIRESNAQESWYFTFELLNSKRAPYTVYVRVHELAPALQGSLFIVTIVAGDKQMQSTPTELQPDASLEVGHDPHFRPDEVQTVRVEIL